MRVAIIAMMKSKKMLMIYLLHRILSYGFDLLFKLIIKKAARSFVHILANLINSTELRWLIVMSGKYSPCSSG